MDWRMIMWIELTADKAVWSAKAWHRYEQCLEHSLVESPELIHCREKLCSDVVHNQNKRKILLHNWLYEWIAKGFVLSLKNMKYAQ